MVDLCNGLIEEKMGIKWYCNTRAHLVDQDLLKLMRKAGCRGISYGIESGSQKILDSVEKSIKVEQCRDAIKWAKEARIKTFASFIFGLPGEDWEHRQRINAYLPRCLPRSC